MDSRRRLEACLSEVGGASIESLRGAPRARFWECFLSERFAYLDEPRLEYVRLALDYASRGYAVVVVTGRPESMRSITLKQLEEAGLLSAVAEVVFRRSGDRRSEWVVKLEAIRRLARKYEIQAVYEDSEAVARELKRAMPELNVILV
ncbi:MAG: hypothetical protein QXS85_04410 [Acidilobaceae archaeon]